MISSIMPTREEPRYNGLNSHQSNNGNLMRPLNHNNNNHNDTITFSNTNHSYGTPQPGSSRSQRLPSELPHNRDDGIEEYVITDIDPPRGFEPEPNSNFRQSTSSSSSSSNRLGSSNSSLSLNGIGSELAKLKANKRHPILDTTNAHSILNTNGDNDAQQGSTRSNSDNSATPSTNRDIIDNHDQIMRPTTSHNDQNTLEQNTKPSTSSHSMFSGFNNFVSRISRAFAQTSMTVLQNTEWCLQQDDVPRFAFAHKKSLEETWKLMDKVVKLCQRPQMNLNNSPPFILEILPETYQLLKLIHTKYDSSDKYPADDNDYSLIFLENLQDRCRQTLKLFKVAKDEMFNEESEHRHKLTRNTLVYNHILSELKAIFPNGYFIGDKYLITKKGSAGEFWRQNFGNSVLVDWKVFYHALQQVHNIDSSFFSLNALKQTIDLTCDEYISIFEFDVFTRLFQPWSTLLKNWQVLAVTHPGYKAFLTYDELKARLQKHIDKPGSYVFRLSCTRLGQWAIGYVTEKGEILQTIVQNISLSQALTDTKVYLYPDGKDEDHNLSILCSGLAGDDRNVTVTEEQYEIYCGVGNSVLTCKICFENDKNIRIEPCNHLLCTMCLTQLQESGSHVCPYCRTEIKETVQIKMDLPRKKH